MKRLSTWLTRNADGVIALVLSVVIGILELAHIVGTKYTEAATLLILALLAATLLRDREREESGGRQVAGLLRDAADVLGQMPSRDRLQELLGTIASMRKALDDASMVRTLNGSEVTDAHSAARQGTDMWVFKGGTGTYIRAVTLPGCVDSARRERRTLKVQLEIIDPTDEEVCRRYADFRRSLSSRPDSTGELWTVDRTRKESFATILAACWYRQRFTFLSIEVGLSHVMTTFRWDMSSRFLIITEEAPNRPAIMIDAEKPYYRAYSRELQASLEQARPVPVGLARDAPLSEEPSVDEARRLFTKMDVQLPRAFTDRDVADIIRKAVRPMNPYE